MKIAENHSRIKKTAVNLITGVVLQLLTVVLNFVVRMMFVRYLGYAYLGTSSLFYNVLTILSVADLGFGTSISISLYTALRNKDEEKIAGILSFYRKIYLIIGGVIFLIGCIITPFIGYLVKTDEAIPLLPLYFFIYLINLISTYFIAYKHAIIKADQKNGILNLINSFVLLGKSILELLVVVIISRLFGAQTAYIAYLIVMVAATYFIEIWSARTAKKLYPYAFKKASLSSEDKKEIAKNVKSLLLYKVCRAFNKAVDSILISSLVGIVILGKYSNYTLIVTTLMGFGCLISRNAIASLGNYVLSETKDKQVEMFKIINFLHIVIAAFFIVNFVGILEPFFHLAFGLDSTLSVFTLLLVAIHLGFDINYQVNELFRETTKMFRKIPYISAINLGLNIILSIVLGIYFGLEGIIGGTLISYFLTSFWFETFALFKYYFKKPQKEIWLKLIYATFSIAIFSAASYFISTKIIVGEELLQLVFSICVSLLCSALSIASMFWWKEFKYLIELSNKIIKPIVDKIFAFLKKEKIQKTLLFLSIVVITCLTILRDLFGIEISKYIFLALFAFFGILFNRTFFTCFVLFIIPFNSGLPIGFIYPLVALFFVLKNYVLFKKKPKILINYLFIPILLVVLELILSTVYGQTASISFLLTLFSCLFIFSFIVYNKNDISFKPLKYFVLGSVFVGLIMLIHWLQIYAMIIKLHDDPNITFIKLLSKNRFGRIDKLIKWGEKWYHINYTHRTSMMLDENENYFGLMMLSSIFASAILILKEKKIFKIFLLILSILVCVLLGTYTGSKSFFISLAIFVLFFLFMLYAESYISTKIVVCLLLIIGGVIAFAAIKIPYVNQMIIGRMDSDSGRIRLIGEYFGYLFKHPVQLIFGVGVTRLKEMTGFSEPPHNAIVQIVGGYGIVGFLIIIAALVVTITKARPKMHLIVDNKIIYFCPLFVFLIFAQTSQIFYPIATLMYGLPVFYLFISAMNEAEAHHSLSLRLYNIMNKKEPEASSGAKIILVTNACGFLGSAICEKLLLSSNHIVVGVDSLFKDQDIRGKKERLKKLKKFEYFIHLKTDCRKKVELQKNFKRSCFNYVINVVDKTYYTDKNDYRESLQSILDCCKDFEVSKLIIASSLFDEGQKPGLSEICAERSIFVEETINELVPQFLKERKMPIIRLKLPYLYGPMCQTNSKIYSILNDLFANPKNTVDGQTNTKEYLFIKDAANYIFNIVQSDFIEDNENTNLYYQSFEIHGLKFTERDIVSNLIKVFNNSFIDESNLIYLLKLNNEFVNKYGEISLTQSSVGFSEMVRWFSFSTKKEMPKTKKRISFVITSLVRCGAETVVVRLANYFNNLGYDTEIIMLLDNKVEFNVPKNIYVVDLSGNRQSRLLRIPYWLKNLKKHFNKRQPDYVISFIARINLLTLLSVNKRKTRVIISERNDPRHDSRTRITWFCINRLYKKADCIVFQSDEAKELFKKDIQKKGVVLYNPIEIEGLSSLNEFDHNLILYAGRFSEQKNVETIINAAELVRKECPSVKFELYGEGPEKEKIYTLIKQKHLEEVVLLKPNIRDIQKRMREARLFVMSSLYEGMSNSLLEASFSGVPCLTTPVLGSSFIKDGINGFFYPFKDYEKLAELIIDQMSNDSAYLKLRKNAIEIAKSYNNLDVYKAWEKTIL